MTHRFECRVYYEDTDLAGIVYYANYLKFIERARSEMLRALGVDQGRMKREDGVVFAVRQVRADYLAPARYDDALIVETRVLKLGGARVVLGQDVQRDGERLFSSEVTIVALRTDGSPARMPAEVRDRLGQHTA
jgi:acyl-CoA thioester hydrolase